MISRHVSDFSLTLLLAIYASKSPPTTNCSLHLHDHKRSSLYEMAFNAISKMLSTYLWEIFCFVPQIDSPKSYFTASAIFENLKSAKTSKNGAHRYTDEQADTNNNIQKKINLQI